MTAQLLSLATSQRKPTSPILEPHEPLAGRRSASFGEY